MITRVAGISAVALALIGGTSAFSSRASTHQSHAQHAIAAPASLRLTTHPMIPAPLPVRPAAGSASSIGNISALGSRNWAGYAAHRPGVKFNKISATMFVPYLNCAVTPRRTFSSAWVGLDGFSSRTVEQDGISADCSGGRAHYAAWWETFPIREIATSIAIHPGDSVTELITYRPGTRKFVMTVRDNTDHQHFTVARRCPVRNCKRNSAEIISEAPGVNGGQSSLADYGAESFASISIAANNGRGGIASRHWRSDAIVQVNTRNHHLLAIPTFLHAGTFDNYWQAKR
jgi:Peptidase A4 family